MTLSDTHANPDFLDKTALRLRKQQCIANHVQRIKNGMKDTNNRKQRLKLLTGASWVALGVAALGTAYYYYVILANS
ncbi:hypothetical protein BDV3_002487 [Batrachochytrium dendrobatidis]|nr:hypothetical protein O5D80_000728 [Batrachochytrium dendrobatidis]KAK5667681.1 hypothetical protein QVD99_005791 [Batrachochytrium dendrobatidis]